MSSISVFYVKGVEFILDTVSKFMLLEPLLSHLIVILVFPWRHSFRVQDAQELAHINIDIMNNIIVVLLGSPSGGA